MYVSMYVCSKQHRNKFDAVLHELKCWNCATSLVTQSPLQN